jgi:hypothetical protein
MIVLSFVSARNPRPLNCGAGSEASVSAREKKR